MVSSYFLLYALSFLNFKERMPLQSGLKIKHKSEGQVVLCSLRKRNKIMTINIINKSHALPNYETIASAGMDLKANLTEPQRSH
jgi:hypothetical protein